jgi:transmembrane sensor
MNHHQELLHKIAAGNSTPEERAALREWLQTLSEQAYQEILVTYGDLLMQQTITEPYNALLLEKINEQIDAATPTPIYRQIWFRWSAAASLLAILLLCWFLFKPAPTPGYSIIRPGGNKAILTLANGQTIVLNNAQNGVLGQQGAARVIKVDSGLLSYQAAGTSNEVQYNTITTPKGGQFQVILPDGSRVWLNAASSLRFPTTFTSEERTVSLTGEAYFDVVPQPEKSFTVAVNHIKVAVLGTTFNIMAYAEEKKTSTTLVTGSVKVSNGNNQVVITAGQEAILLTGNTQLTTNNANITAAIAWKDGKFLFNETDIYTIMRQVARWYDVDIRYEGDLTGITLSGGISRQQYITQLLEILQTTGNVKFELKGKQIIVMAAHK